MPAERKSQPLPEHAPLAKAIALRLAEKPGMTQVSVAERSELSYELVNSYARGQGNPSYLNFMALADGLELLPKELMERVEALRKLASGAEPPAPQ
jgi:transcriptional regulator with XRE-family HTH domain